MDSNLLLFLLPALSWFLMFLFGRPLIEWLKYRKGMKWAPREDTPDSHLAKAGVPSMGGIGIIGFAFVAFLLTITLTYAVEFFASRRLQSHYIESAIYLLTLPIFVVSNAVLGYVDDYSKATNKGGLSSKQKFLLQIILAVVFVFFLAINWGDIGNTPFSWWLAIGALLIIIGTSNAVNLTDGIDGLAAGLSIQVAMSFSLLYFSYGERMEGVFSTIPFWLALGGACLGFLAYNKHPAKVFMGDTGSLALGAALGAGAILTKTVFLLPFIGFIFFVEMFSVIFQVAYFKYTKKKFGEGKRLFRRAPLHHHFELGGWSEWRVVLTFWGVNLCTTILGLILWNMGVLPRFP